MDLMQIRRRMLGKRTSTIPSIYQEVEYIESTYGQYIRIDGTFTSEGEIECDGKILPQDNGVTYPRLWGNSFINTISYGHCVKAFTVAVPLIYNAYFRFGNSNEKSYGLPIAIRSRQLTKKDGVYYLTLDGFEKIVELNGTGSADESSYDYVCALFGSIQRDYSVSNLTVGRIYYFGYRVDGNPVHDMYPVYRKSDGEIGLYDTVTGKFYTNEGTGTFLKGADV